MIKLYIDLIIITRTPVFFQSYQHGRTRGAIPNPYMTSKPPPHPSQTSVVLEYPHPILPPFAHPTHIRQLKIIGGGVTDIRAIKPLRALYWLCIRGGTDEPSSSSPLDLRPIATLPQLRRLLLVNLRIVTDFSTLRALRHLDVLRIDRCLHFDDMRVLEGCRHDLRTLDIAPAEHVRELPYFPKLERLFCRLPKGVSDLGWLPGVMPLDQVNDPLDHAKNDHRQTHPKTVHVSASPSLYNLTALRRCIAIQHLSLDQCPQIKSVAEVAHLLHLRTLDVSRTSVTDLTPLTKCVWLHTLQADQLRLEVPLPILPAVRSLDFRYTCTQAIVDRLPTAVPSLTALDISGDIYHRAIAGVTSLLPLLGCAELCALDVRFIQGMTSTLLEVLLTDPRGFTRFRLGSSPPIRHPPIPDRPLADYGHSGGILSESAPDDRTHTGPDRSL